MELSILRQRSQEALKQKARRGELFMTVAIGYVRVGHDRIEKDPDRRISEAIALVFAKFGEMQSVRQVHLWFRHEVVPLPAVVHGGEGRQIVWKPPLYNTVLHILTNPIYAALTPSDAREAVSALPMDAKRLCGGSGRSARTGTF